MQPANLPLDLYRGDSGSMRVTLLDKAQQPIDLTGAVAKCEIRDRPAGAQVTALTCVITLPNIIDVTLSAADSQKLPAKGVWDLQLTYASGEVKTPIGGQVQVTPDVTDSTPFATQLPILPIP
jgi:hypothetical protein